MSVTQYQDPFSNFLKNIFHNSEIYKSNWDENNIFQQKWPKCDIKEDNKSYQIIAELPGMNKNDININYENDMLVISGNKKQESSEKNNNYSRREILTGSFSRSFSISNGDYNKITALYENGLLKIHIPKCEKAIRKSITIR